jgi:hypothetical protein
MKRTVVSLRGYAGAGSVLLTLSLLVTGGCSGSGDEANDGAGSAAARYGLDRSEFIALKKANKNPKNFRRAILEKRIEKLKEEGVNEETTTSRKTTKQTR